MHVNVQIFVPVEYKPKSGGLSWQRHQACAMDLAPGAFQEDAGSGQFKTKSILFVYAQREFIQDMQLPVTAVRSNLRHNPN